MPYPDTRLGSGATYYTSGSSNFELEVTATDAENNRVVNWIEVEVQSPAPECLDM